MKKKISKYSNLAESIQIWRVNSPPPLSIYITATVLKDYSFIIPLDQRKYKIYLMFADSCFHPTRP